MEILKIKEKSYQFNRQNLLGKGAFGSVYVGCDQDTKKKVAIKLIQFNNEAEINKYQQEIFIMESIMNQLEQQDKAFFSEVLDYTCDMKNNRIIIVMGYCNLNDLDNYLKRNKELDEKKATNLIFQLIYALKCLNTLNIVHRDIKPANILLHYDEETKKIQLKLTDFGCARHNESNIRYPNSSKDDTSTIDDNVIEVMRSSVGTPLYMSPQILKRQIYTSKSDIWSLGILYYQMLFGMWPWPIKDLDQYVKLLEKKKSINFPKHINSIAPNVQEFIKKCLEYEERDRYDWNDIFNHDLFKPHFNEMSIKFKQDSEPIDHPKEIDKLSNEKKGAIESEKEKKELDNETSNDVKEQPKEISNGDKGTQIPHYQNNLRSPILQEQSDNKKSSDSKVKSAFCRLC